MAKIAEMSILKWGNEFVVTGRFNNMEIIFTRSFTDYSEALKEMRRQLLREELRYEASPNSHFTGPFHWDGIPLSPESD